MTVRRELTTYGFAFGAAEVERTAELDEGRVVITLKSPRARLEVYVTRTGRMRVFDRGQGWRPVELSKER